MIYPVCDEGYWLVAQWCIHWSVIYLVIMVGATLCWLLVTIADEHR